MPSQNPSKLRASLRWLPLLLLLSCGVWFLEKGEPVRLAIQPETSAVQKSAKTTGLEAWVMAHGQGQPLSADTLAEGISLVKQRRLHMEELMRTDPATALAQAMPAEQRDRLPAEMAAEVEVPVAGQGCFGMLAICQDHLTGDHGSGCRVMREAFFENQRYEVATYGRGLQRKTTMATQLTGVRLGQLLALEEPSAADLAAEEARLMGSGKLAASGTSLNPVTPPTGPAPPTTAFNQYSGSFSHQYGPKTCFVMLVRPSDGPAWSSPPTEASMNTQMNTLSQWYYNASYRKTWFGPQCQNAGTPQEIIVPRLVVTPVLNVPGTISNYYDSLFSMFFDGKTLLEAMGGDWANNGVKDPDRYDRVVIMSNTKLIASTGLAYVGGSLSWTGGSLDSNVAIHELGHNWGCVHANAWTPAAGTHPRNAVGSHSEYGDGFDVMGGGGQEFNALYKEKIGFLRQSEGELANVSTSGTYRVFDQYDAYSSNPMAKLRGLILPVTGYTEYNKRVLFSFYHGNGVDGGSGRGDWNRNALIAHADDTSANTVENDGTHVLDTTPGSRQVSDLNDSAIKIGRTYSDGPTVNGTSIIGGFHVTPVARGSVSVSGQTHEYMDVVVNVGAAAGNVAPTISLAASNTAPAAAVSITLTASAADANGDTLAYDWDYGDGNVSITNSATQTKSWAANGLYKVTCKATDMKGGVTTGALWINVGGAPYRAADTATTVAGVSYRYYEGSFNNLPNFAQQFPVAEENMPSPSISPRLQNENFAFKYEGYLNVPAQDIYTLFISADDGARLWIGNQLVVDNDGTKTSALETSGNVALMAGRHAFRLEYFHRSGSESLDLNWSTLTNAKTSIPASAFTRLDFATNAPPVVSLSSPTAGSTFIVNTDVTLQATATDVDGIAKVVFFSGNGFLGEDSTAPYSTTWPRVSAGAKNVSAVAYDNTGRCTVSATISFTVASPPTRNSIGINFQGGASAQDGTLNIADAAGAVYVQTFWNNIVANTGTQPALRDQNGNATTASLFWNFLHLNGYTVTAANVADANGRLMRGGVWSRDTTNPRTLTVSSIPYLEYEVYLYFDSPENNAADNSVGEWKLNGVSRFGRNSLVVNDGVGDYPTYDSWSGFREATATVSTAPAEQLMGNYFVWRGVKGSAFTVDVVQTTRPINAIQIVEQPASQPSLTPVQTANTTAVAEGGTTDTYAIAASHAPTAPVTINLTAGPQVLLDKSSVTITAANWQQMQTITVRAVDDSVAEAASLTESISHAVVATGTNYSGVSLGSLAVTVADNDAAIVQVSTAGTAVEGSAATAKLRVYRTGPTGFAAPLTVNLALSGIGTLNTDFTLANATVAAGIATVTIPALAADVFVTLSPLNDADTEGTESAIFTLQTSPDYAVGTNNSGTLAIRDDETTDYFTEEFKSTDFMDLVGNSFTFTPNASSYILTVAKGITSFPAGTTSFTGFNEGAMTGGSSDDGFWSLAQPARLFGTNYTSFFISTNGSVHMSVGQNSFGFGGHFMVGNPTISVLSKDLNPGAAGDVRWKRDTVAPARTIIWYDNVRFYGGASTDIVNAQLEMFDSGILRLTYLAVTPGAGFVGISTGVDATMPSDINANPIVRPFYESDLTSYAEAAGQPPAFATQPVLTAVQNAAYSYQLAVTDPDPGSILTITAPTKPVWLSLSSPANGAAILSGTPTAPGSFPISLSASDGSLSATQAYTLLVIPATGNNAPVLSGTVPSIVHTGQSFTVNLTATDADSHSISIQPIILPAWLTLTDNANGTATLSGTPPLNSPATVQGTLLVTDTLAASSLSFTLTVNRPPTLTLVRPAATSFEMPNATNALHLEASIVDESAATLTWSQISGPGTTTFSNATSPNSLATFSTSGVYALRATATDSVLSTARDFIVGVGSTAATARSAGLVGYWPCNEGTGASAADTSGAGLTATLNGGALFSAEGYQGSCYYSFDGNNNHSASFNCPDLPLITVSGWIQTSDVVATRDRVIFGISDNEFRVYQPNASKKLRILSDRTTDGIWTTINDIPAGRWFHLVVSYDSNSNTTNPNVYFDGILQTLTRDTAPVGTRATTAGVAKFGNFSATAWKGKIDEVRLYSRIVPVTEIPLLATPGALNAAPSVDAGADVDLAISGSRNLAGAATDDAQPAPPALTTLWIKETGPNATLVDTAALTTPFTASNQPGPVNLRLHADDGQLRTSDTVVVSITGPPPLSYTNWIATFSGISSTQQDADPDRDGLTNLAEYAFNTSPTQATTGPVVGNAAGHLTLTYRQRKNGIGTTGINYTAAGVIYAVEASTSLQGGSWQTSPALVSAIGLPVDKGDGTEEVTVQLIPTATTHQRYFLHLRLTQQ